MSVYHFVSRTKQQRLQQLWTRTHQWQRAGRGALPLLLSREQYDDVAFYLRGSDTRDDERRVGGGVLWLAALTIVMLLVCGAVQVDMV